MRYTIGVFQESNMGRMIGISSVSEICFFHCYCHQISLGPQDFKPISGKKRWEKREDEGEDRREKNVISSGVFS